MDIFPSSPGGMSVRYSGNNPPMYGVNNTHSDHMYTPTHAYQSGNYGNMYGPGPSSVMAPLSPPIPPRSQLVSKPKQTLQGAVPPPPPKKENFSTPIPLGKDGLTPDDIPFLLCVTMGGYFLSKAVETFVQREFHGGRTMTWDALMLYGVGVSGTTYLLYKYVL